MRDLIRDICGQHEVQIMKGHVAKDHVHLMVSIPPQGTVSRLLQWLKGKTAHHLLAEFPHLKKQFWGRHLWARGYFCCSSGNVTDEVIAKYIGAKKSQLLGCLRGRQRARRSAILPPASAKKR